MCRCELETKSPFDVATFPGVARLSHVRGTLTPSKSAAASSIHRRPATRKRGLALTLGVGGGVGLADVSVALGVAVAVALGLPHENPGDTRGGTTSDTRYESYCATSTRPSASVLTKKGSFIIAARAGVVPNVVPAVPVPATVEMFPLQSIMRMRWLKQSAAAGAGMGTGGSECSEGRRNRAACRSRRARAKGEAT